MNSTPVRRRGGGAPVKPDVIGLVMGSLITLFAAGTLFMAFGGDFHGGWLKAAIPILLIAIGGAGLALSRGRDR